MLDWYGARINDACSMTMITLPFNVAPSILKALDRAPRPLRLAILETEPTKEVREAEFRNKGKLAFSNGAIMGKNFVHKPKGGATVAPISQGALDDWFIEEELARPTNHGHVFFLHSKILLIDPLSDDPLICTGSANFSLIH
jgi:phosphatidylserine/phosphatidylglycerophosphate/cardiolipin synthase-like enzyme